MEGQNMLLPDIKEEDLSTTLNLPEKMEFIEIIKSNQSSTIDEQNNFNSGNNKNTSPPRTNDISGIDTSDNNIISPDNTTILLSSSTKMQTSSNEDLALLPPLPNTDELNVPEHTHQHVIQPSPLHTELTAEEPLTDNNNNNDNNANEELNLTNALDMNTIETTHLSRSSSLKSVLKSTISNQELTKNDDIISHRTQIHFPLPKALSRSNSQRRDRNTSFSSVSSSSSPSPISQVPTTVATNTNTTTNSTSPKFQLLRRASSSLLRKTSIKSTPMSNNNNNNNNNTNNSSSTSISSLHNIRTSPLLLSNGFDNNIITKKSAPSTTAAQLPKTRPSLKLRLSSNTLSPTTSSNNISQLQQSPLQRNNSILSRKSSLGSKMKLNLSRIISGSNNKHSHPHPSRPIQSPGGTDHITTTSPNNLTPTHPVNDITNRRTITVSRKLSSNNPSPSTISSFPRSHSNNLSKMIPIDIEKINKPKSTIITLDDTLQDIVSISKESNVSTNLILTEGENQISLKDYYSLLKDWSHREDSQFEFIQAKFNQSGWCSQNELNQLKQKRIIINKLWREKLHSYEI